LKEIDQATFRKTAIKSIRIPKTVEKIRRDCFVGCKSLSEVIFEPDSPLKELDERVFKECNVVSLKVPAGFRVRSEWPCNWYCMGNVKITLDYYPALVEK
jgi:hypothetical protein